MLPFSRIRILILSQLVSTRIWTGRPGRLRLCFIGPPRGSCWCQTKSIFTRWHLTSVCRLLRAARKRKMLVSFSLDDSLVSRPREEISESGWFTEVEVEQQQQQQQLCLTDSFDPAPVELLCSVLRAAAPLIHFNNPPIHSRFKPRLTSTQQPFLSNLRSPQIHRLPYLSV